MGCFATHIECLLICFLSPLHLAVFFACLPGPLFLSRALAHTRAQFSSIESLLIERHVMHICDHASIVGLRTYFETKHFMFFVMELIHGGNTIDKVVAAVGRVPENMYEFMACVCVLFSFTPEFSPASSRSSFYSSVYFFIFAFVVKFSLRSFALFLC
jgi:hypothetical protein